MSAKNNSKGIKISPRYYQKDWDDLVLETRDSPDWDIAIKIFEDRMEGRFLKQIEILDKNPDRKIGVFAGFAIMALDCLFIETLEQFFKGKIRTGQGMDEKAFFDFFQRSSKFKAFLTLRQKRQFFINKYAVACCIKLRQKGKQPFTFDPKECFNG